MLLIFICLLCFKVVLFFVYHSSEGIFFGRSIENTDLWAIFVEKRSE